MKKILSIILTTAILLTVFCVGAVSASAANYSYDTSISVGSGTMVADIGETFTYTVKVKCTRAVAAGQIEIPVDFSYLSGESAAVINAKLDDVAPAIADTARVYRFDTPNTNGLTGYVVNFASDGAYDFTAETPLITLSFTVLKAGSISLKPSFREFLDDSNAELVTMDGVIVGGALTSSVAVTLPKSSTAEVKTPRISSITSVSNGLNIEWNAVDNAPKYGIYRHDNGWVLLASITGTSYVDTNVVSGQSYLYTVRAMSEAGKNISGLVSCGWSATYIAQPAVASLVSDTDGLHLTISEVNGASRFRIYRKSGGGWVGIGDVSGHTFLDASVIVGTQYTYSVCAIDQKGRAISSRSATGYSAYHLGAPVLKSVTAAVGYVTVAWDKMTGAERYCVFRKDPDNTWYPIAYTTGTSYNDKVVTSGKTYTYTVRCVSKTDNNKYTSPYNIAGKAITYVAAPTITKRTNVYGGVSLTWSKSAGAAKYRVFRKQGSASWVKVVDTTALTYVDKTVKNNVAYTYSVRCLNKSNAFVSAYNTTGWKITYLAAPAPKSAANIYGGVRFSWTKTTGAAKYRVYRKAGKGSWTALGVTNKLYFDDKKAASGTTYTYTVCCMASDGKTVTSGYNPTGKTVKYIAAPTLKSVKKSGKTVKFVWTKPKGAVKFRVMRKVGNGKWAKLADTTATSWTDKKVKAKTKYTYTVYCISKNGKTVESAYNPTGKAITYK